MLDNLSSSQDEQKNNYISGRKNILVTGGAGFLGSNLCEILVKKNNVICVDNYLTGQESNIDHLLQLPNFEFIKHDITESLDLNTLREAQSFKVEFQGIQEIYHAASPTHFRDHQDFPLETSLVNSIGTKNVLEWAKQHKSKVVLFSTSLVYGDIFGESMINESMMGVVDPVGPRNCYVEGKRYAESLADNYRQKHGVDVKIARIFNTYGPRMRSSDNLLIPQFIKNALNDEAIDIEGEGDEMVSACYVRDVLDGVMKLMASDIINPINLGSDTKTKISDLAQKIIEISGSEVKINHTKSDGITVSRRIPDIKMAKDKLEWVPVVSLDAGLKETIEDFKLSQRRVKSLS